MDKFSMAIVSGGIGSLVASLLITILMDNAAARVFSRLTKVTYAEAAQMKTDCEATLPRDRFCITELIVREEKQ